MVWMSEQELLENGAVLLAGGSLRLWPSISDQYTERCGRFGEETKDDGRRKGSETIAMVVARGGGAADASVSFKRTGAIIATPKYVSCVF